MTIDPVVRAVAKDFGLDPALLQAVERAEGNILKAVQCSIPSVQTREQALRITARSAVHAMSDYIRTSQRGPFVQFWAARWAPQGAKNDPTNLNANWPKNVLTFWNSAA